jgi:hypothetical protein
MWGGRLGGGSESDHSFHHGAKVLINHSIQHAPMHIAKAIGIEADRLDLASIPTTMGRIPSLVVPSAGHFGAVSSD